MSKTPKELFWAIQSQRNGGYYLVDYWTKSDKSNLLTLKTISLDETKVRRHIEELTGKKNFTLVFVKAGG